MLYVAMWVPEDCVIWYCSGRCMWVRRVEYGRGLSSYNRSRAAEYYESLREQCRGENHGWTWRVLWGKSRSSCWSACRFEEGTMSGGKVWIKAERWWLATVLLTFIVWLVVCSLTFPLFHHYVSPTFHGGFRWSKVFRLHCCFLKMSVIGLLHPSDVSIVTGCECACAKQCNFLDYGFE